MFGKQHITQPPGNPAKLNKRLVNYRVSAFLYRKVSLVRPGYFFPHYIYLTFSAVNTCLGKFQFYPWAETQYPNTRTGQCWWRPLYYYINTHINCYYQCAHPLFSNTLMPTAANSTNSWALLGYFFIEQHQADLTSHRHAQLLTSAMPHSKYLGTLQACNGPWAATYP